MRGLGRLAADFSVHARFDATDIFDGNEILVALYAPWDRRTPTASAPLTAVRRHPVLTWATLRIRREGDSQRATRRPTAVTIKRPAPDFLPRPADEPFP
jgi:hypothetical protein